MTIGILASLGAIIALLVLSAFFSGSETALTATSRALMLGLERQGSAKAALVQKLISAKETLIGAILLGNNFVNILASALATSLLVEFFGDSGVIYATLVMTALVLIFAEVLPKTYAIAHPERMALAVAPIIRIFVAIFGPITRVVQIIVRHVLAFFGVDMDEKTAVLSAHEEIRGAIDLHHLEGGVIKDDRDMLSGLLNLREMEVSDVMVHRTKMLAVDVARPTGKIISELLESGFSRIPLWRNDPDNIIGILHAKNLLRALSEAKGRVSKINIEKISTKPWFVPDTTNLQDQLDAFLTRKTHFAVVVDEYGEVMGLLTLEDILEEIVGEIADEHDEEVIDLEPDKTGAIKVDGTLPVRDINRTMDWSLPDDEATTIAGLVIHEAQTIPEPSQVFTFYGYMFEILKRQRNQITLIKISPVQE
jgi:Mg2+/Co2+ transporter CorB